MGLFSGKKKIYVSSVVYPLGEDEGPKKRDYLKYTVLNATLTGAPSLGSAISDGYLKGQGMALRNCYQYARDKYAHGVPMSAANYLEEPNRDELTAVLAPKHPGSTIEYLALVTGTADHEWWAEQHLALEYGYDRTQGTFERPPVGVDANAAIAYDLEPNGMIRILLMSAGGATKVIDYRPKDYVAMADFVHCCYQAVQVFTSAAQTTVRPATPGETDSVSTSVTIVERPGGEIQTTTERTTIDVDVSGINATVIYRKEVEVRTRPQYFLYRLGAGTYSAIDAWAQSEDLQAPYYPAIPLRVNNVDMCAEAKQDTDLYKTSKKFLKRVGVDIDDLAESLNGNEGIKDVDFAFVVFGVALNTQGQEGKRYLFNFFEYLRGITAPATTKSSHSIWATAFNAGQKQQPPQVNMIQVYSEKDRANNYDIKIQWDYIDTKLVEGQVFPGAGIGDVEISMAPVRREFSFGALDIVLDSSVLYARRQVDADTYEELEIAGLVYDNYIYKGKAVTVTAYDMFHDPDEMGFIVPLNQQVLRSMSLRDVTDLSYYCCHMVLNCYKVVKQKWYQTSIFKIILMIVAIVLMVFFPPAGVAMMATMIATTIAVSILIATIIAAVIYMLAAMIIMNIIMKVATQVFGEKWGAIIAIVAMFVLGNWGDAAGAAAGAASTGVTAVQVMNATTAVLQAYSHYAGYQAGQVMKDITKLQEQYEQKFDELEKKTEEMLGTNTDVIDIQGITDATYRHFFEPMDTFLGRTLLVGGDIAEITNDQVTNFAQLGLQLPTIG